MGNSLRSEGKAGFGRPASGFWGYGSSWREGWAVALSAESRFLGASLLGMTTLLKNLKLEAQSLNPALRAWPDVTGGSKFASVASGKVMSLEKQLDLAQS